MGVVKTQSDEIHSYLSDSSALSGGHCEGVFIPESVEELREFVRACSRKKESLTVVGGHTGTVGGSVSFGGWAVSMEKLNQITRVNSGVQVGAGVVLKDLQQTVNSWGYFYPPNPTETASFIGGNIATNASGTRSFKYGSTRNFVEALDVMFVDGRVAHVERGSTNAFVKTDCGDIHFVLPEYTVPDLKYAMGYWVKHPMDAMDLFVGSEGTLGIVTEARLKLLPAPKYFLGGIFFFSAFEDAYQWVKKFQQMRRQGQQAAMPCTVEYYDEYSLKMMGEICTRIPDNACVALYLEEEVWDDGTGVLERWSQIEALDGSFIADDVRRQRELIEIRHSLPAQLAEFFARHQVQKISTDFAVPENQFLDFYRWCCALLADQRVRYVAFGHMGDCNIHINLLAQTLNEHQAYMQVYEQMMRKVLEVGGVVSAEHGVGKIKRRWMTLQFSEKQLRQMKQLKKAFDPQGLLNPGNLLPD